MTTALTPLANAALVGFARKQPAWPDVPGEIGVVLAGLDAAEAEARWLRAAGVMSLAAEAGLEPGAAGDALPLAPAEELPVAGSAKLRGAVAQLLAGGPVEILCELLGLLAVRRRVLPPEFLPSLLTAAANKPALRRAIGQMPGRRHRWLAELNPDWRAVLAESVSADGALPESLWTNGTLAERLAVLRDVRRADAARGRTMLAEALPGEAAKERQEILAVFGESLGAEDEAFLETLLTDKSKGVRQLAASLLSRLPQSAHAQRMSTRLAAVVTLEKKLLRGAKLDITPPENFDPAWAKDAIEEKPPQGEGAKAFWLRQMATFMPLAWWTTHTQQDPATVIALLAKSDWAAPFLRGIADAMLAQHDAVWAAALVAHGPVKEVPLDLAAIAAVPGPACVEAYLTQLAAKEFPAALVQATQLAAWSEPFADAMMQRLRAACTREPDYTLCMALPGVALCLPPSRLATAAEGWQEFLDKPYLRSPLDSFLQSIQLRRTIHEEL